MTAVSLLRYDKNKLRKWLHEWFGTNCGSHWTVAVFVAVIIFGGYLIYNDRDRNPTAANIGSAPERNLHAMTPGPFPLKK